MCIALLVIEVQKDFCDGGVLPAKNTASLIPPLNELIHWSVSRHIPCIYTRDWHQADHCSFINQGGPWHPHCVQNTPGSEFADGLVIVDAAVIIDIEKESLQNNMTCSAFENTNLYQTLKDQKITDLIVTGIATDYSVKTTVIDALRFGFDVVVITDLVRPIDNKPNDSNSALEEMESAGAVLLATKDWYANLI